MIRTMTGRRGSTGHSRRWRLLAPYRWLVERVGGLRTNWRRLRRPWLVRCEIREAAARCPTLGGLADELRPARRRVAATWRRYTRDVSDPRFALSLETCAVLDAICRCHLPARILDLGSGFSSWVFRRYQSDRGPGVSVKSVDDDPSWLGRTHGFLAAEGLPVDGLCDLRSLDAEDTGAYDLVCYDLGNMETRARELPRSLSFARPGTGVVIVDDVHYDDYRAVVETELRRRGVRATTLRNMTIDRMGRFSWLVTGL